MKVPEVRGSKTPPHQGSKPAAPGFDEAMRLAGWGVTRTKPEKPGKPMLDDPVPPPPPPPPPPQDPGPIG